MLNYIMYYFIIGFILTVIRHWMKVKQIENYNNNIWSRDTIKFSKWYPVITVLFLILYPLFIIKSVLMWILDLISKIIKFGFR